MAGDVGVNAETRPAVYIIAACAGAFLALLVGVAVYAYWFAGGLAPGDSNTIDCSYFLRGGYTSYMHQGWLPSSESDIANCESCPYLCSNVANGGSITPGTYTVRLTYCPSGSHVVGRHTDAYGYVVVARCS